MNKNRDMKIIKSIISRNGPVTIDTIAAELEVSNRTVRNSLSQVEKIIINSGLCLKRKPGVGISIEGADEIKCKLRSEMELTIINGSIEPYTPEDRKNFMLKKLFMNEEDISTSKLAKELYVSQVTIQKDLKDVKEWLDHFKLKLMRCGKSSIKITGKEEDCRNAIANFIASNNGYEELKRFLYNKIDQNIHLLTKTKLAELIDLNYDHLENIVANAEKSLEFNFSDEAFTSLVIHIAISIKRLKEGKDILLPHNDLRTIRKRKEYFVARQIAQDIEKAFHIKLPEQEIGYIFLHIIGAKMLQSPMEMESIKLKIKDEDHLAVVIAKDVIKVAEKALSLDFRNDRQLLNGLILHLRPTINRLEYGLSLRNPLLDQIKENYPEVYGAAWMTNSIFKKYLGKKIMDEEIGYIAMHLGAAVERKRKPLRTLVVCSSGIGTAQLLAVRLEKRFKRIEIKGIQSISSLEANTLKDIDIIISTIPVNAEKPSLTVSPMLTQNDIRRIELFINNLENKNNSEESLFDKELIFIDYPYTSKKLIIDNLCLKLVKKGCIEDDYGQEVQNREEAYTTEIGKGVAIPHSKPEYVVQSKIAVAVLQKPIQWKEEQVDIIFLVAISNNNLKWSMEMLRNFYKEIDSDKFLNELRKSKDKNRVIKLLNKICFGHDES